MIKISKSHLFAVKGSAMMADLQAKELERRLSLYQVFLKLYEHHSELLEEILQLENLYQPSLAKVKLYYIQGVVDASAVYVMTNLCENQTQTLQQPQQIWTVGRDRSSGICVADTYLSRRHAAIQYIENQGFYLIDFNSTNGSFVNGERAYQPIQLQDGDRLRLGSMTINFFLNGSSRVLPSVAMELLMHLTPQREFNQDDQYSNIAGTEKYWHKQSISPGLMENLAPWQSGLSPEEQSDILERFFSRTKPYTNS